MQGAVAMLLVLPWSAAALAVTLTDTERAYLSKLGGEVSLCVDPDWAPFEQIDADGRHVGIAADLLAKVAERTGVRFRLVVTRDWPESLEASRAGRCQALSLLNQTSVREAWLVFTQPILVDENVLITREEHPFIAELGRFEGESMALPKGTAIEEWMRRDYPGIRVILTDTEAEALEMVSAREADMTARSLIVAAHTIKHEGWFNLKIAGQMPGHGNALRIGVAKDQPMLRDILDKGVASISPLERQQIVDRHITIAVTKGIDYRLVANLAGVLALVIATSLYWMQRLRKANGALRASEAALRAAKEKADAIASDQRQFIAMMSHEVRTPLTIIDSAVQVLKLHAQGIPEQLRVIERIDRGALRLADFFAECLTADRINSDDFRVECATVDVPTLLRDALEHARFIPTTHALLVDAPAVPPLYADPTLLRVALQNLIANALRYAPEGSTITVRAYAGVTGVIFAIEDEGPGITVAEAAQIVRKYRRGQASQGKPGAGLGLAIVQRIAELHGGVLRITPGTRDGSVFVLEIPLGNPQHGD